MLLDLGNQIGVLYAPTAHGATVNIQTANYIDLLVKQEEFAGQTLFWYSQCAVAPTSGGSATLQFQLIGNASDPTFASGNVVILESPYTATAYTNVVANQILTNMPIPRQLPDAGSLAKTDTFLRYIAFGVLIGTADLTAGQFNSWITPRPIQDNLSNAAGYSFP
jgi:hypothetical protein